MKLYEKNLIISIIEAKLLETFEEYTPQGMYNNTFIQYLYRYIRINTYSGEHNNLLQELIELRNTNPLFKDVIIKEKEDKKTFSITSNTNITSDMYITLNNIIKNYYNYDYNVISKNKIEFVVQFGWLPPSTASWLNLLNDDCLIDYYIDGITLRPNTYSRLGSRKPDSGYMCYKIDNLKAYNTIMFLADTESMAIKGLDIPKYTVATLLEELEGSKGATLNRVAVFDVENFFYELGPYNQNYLTAEKSSLIIQVPYDYLLSEYYYIFDVSNSVVINNKNNPNDPNNPDNYYVSFTDKDFSNKFIKNTLHNINNLAETIINNKDKLDITVQQFVLGDFIWKTSDSKLIAYAQNLVNATINNKKLISDGIWNNELSDVITLYKTTSTTDRKTSIFDDDVLDKNTEIELLDIYNKLYPDLDYNEQLFNEW